jgi:2-polyprenyl-3-methyl-5-hydroxy-6-metoxy-1,4-benzoquinol methylase
MSVKKIIPEPCLIFIRDYILKKPSIHTIKNLLKVISSPIRNKMYSRKLDKLEKNGQVSKNAIDIIFKDCGDDFWFWLLARGYVQRSYLRNIMPSLPEEHYQLQYTGLSGVKALAEAFSFYKFIKITLKNQGVMICPESKVLDYGCGWGRIIRFFLKDINASNLYGIDCDEEIIKVCQTSNLNCNFNVNNIFPPTKFEDNYFDIIYSFSVFSHLSENAHINWLLEFKRILKPGGVLIVTTRDRDFIISCARIREIPETDIPFFAKGLASTFLNTSESLMKYDSGKYVYEPIGGGGVLEGSFYGETCIPEKYVETEWLNYFSQIDFVNYKKHQYFNQNAILAQK